MFVTSKRHIKYMEMAQETIDGLKMVVKSRESIIMAYEESVNKWINTLDKVERENENLIYSLKKMQEALDAK